MEEEYEKVARSKRLEVVSADDGLLDSQDA